MFRPQHVFRRRAPIASGCLAAALLAGPGPAAAQDPAPPRTLASCEDKRTALAVSQALGVNLAINRANAWLFRWEFGHVGFESWSRNLRRGWKWDATQFGVNSFVHPYHGSLYFTAGRANCLNYWESIPVTFLGSWVWEYFGETHRASLNDFYTTGLGGAALGEVLHRVSWAVLDEEARGGERIARELLALAINPVGGLNRLFRGQWMRRGENPVDRVPEAYLFRARVGGRSVEETRIPKEPRVSPTVIVDIGLGDPFDTPYRAPFDVVSMSAQVSPDGGGLNLLRTVGRLWGRELTSTESAHRHQLMVNQRLDYVNNPVYNYGEQTLEIGLRSRWSAQRNLRVHTRLAADFVALGAVEALDEARGTRTIDWGPALGAIAEVSLDYQGQTYLTFYNRVRYLSSVSGSPARHTLLFSGFDFLIPLTSDLGIGAYVSVDQRRSDYTAVPDVERSYTETRVYFTWTPAFGTPLR